MEQTLSTFINEFTAALAKSAPIFIKKLIFLAILWVTYKPVQGVIMKAFNTFFTIVFKYFNNYLLCFKCYSNTWY